MPDIELSGIVEAGKVTQVGEFRVSLEPLPTNPRKFFMAIERGEKLRRVRHYRKNRIDGRTDSGKD